MTTGKIFGILGAGTLLALGITASEPTTPLTNTPTQIVVPEVKETIPVEKQTDTTHDTTQTEQPTSETKVPNPVEEPVAKTPVTAQPAKILPPPTIQETKPTSNCHPSYSGCLKMNAGDYDCAGGTGNGPNYTGRVQVFGSDPFDLDRDGNGWGCENS